MVSAEEFVTIWQETWKSGGTVSDIAAKCDLDKKAVAARATHLRKQGVELMRFKPRYGNDYGKLAALAQSLVDQDGKEEAPRRRAKKGES